MPDETPAPLVYRQLMAIKPSGMSANKWLETAGVNRSFFTDLKRRGNARLDTIDRLLEAVGKTRAEFLAMTPPSIDPTDRRDEEQSGRMPFLREDEQKDVPVLGTALGADFELHDDGTVTFAEVTELYMDEVVDHLRRPLALRGRRSVYGFYTVGFSMSPKYEPGDPGYVDPEATPRIGDEVLVYLIKRDGDGEGRIHSVLLKRLVKRTAAYIE